MTKYTTEDVRQRASDYGRTTALLLCDIIDHLRQRWPVEIKTIVGHHHQRASDKTLVRDVPGTIWPHRRKGDA